MFHFNKHRVHIYVLLQLFEYNRIPSRRVKATSQSQCEFLGCRDGQIIPTSLQENKTVFVIQLISILSKDDKMFTSYFHPEVVFSRKYCQIKIIIPVQHYANSRIEALQWKGILVALRSSFLLRVLEVRINRIILSII